MGAPPIPPPCPLPTPTLGGGLPGEAPRPSAYPCAPVAPAALVSGIWRVWPATTRSLVKPFAAFRAWTVVLCARAIRLRVSPDLRTYRLFAVLAGAVGWLAAALAGVVGATLGVASGRIFVGAASGAVATGACVSDFAGAAATPLVSDDAASAEGPPEVSDAGGSCWQPWISIPINKT